MLREVTLEGPGLHSGLDSRVTLRTTTGPVQLVGPDFRARVDELEVVATARATTVQPRHDPERGRTSTQRIGTVEHLFGALAGLGIHDGMEVRIDGPEVPLLDGGASAWCRAVGTLALSPCLPKLRVTRPYAIDVGPSRYELSPSEGIDVEVHLELDDSRLAPVARWQGDPADFVERIAPARTFAWAHEVDELLRRGLARHVDPRSVVLIAPDVIHSAGHPFAPDEPGRHKLLDLLGDLYLAGGPPLGRVVAHRPGHAANARAVRRAVEDGALAVTGARQREIATGGHTSR